MAKMNENVARSNVNFFPGYASVAEETELNFLGRRLYEAGVIEMAPSTKPPGFFINWTTVTSLVVVISAIVGLWYFTWQTAEQRGIEKGRIEAEKAQQQREMEKMQNNIRILEERLKQAGQ